jgi:hypothetical protein
MTQPESPLKRSIGLSNVVRGLIALFAVVAIGAAFAAGRVALAIAGLVFFAVAAALGYRAWRVRQALDADTRSRDPK